MSCPKCGGNLESKIVGSTLVVRCARCGWSVARTYIEPIREDETAYCLYLENGNPTDISTLSCLSKVVGCNLLQARRIVSGGRSLIFKGSAVEVRKWRDQLDAAGVEYSIEPDFPY